MLHEGVSLKFLGRFLISANARVEKDVPHAMTALSYFVPETHVGVTVVDRSLSRILLLNTIISN
jgi:hypothetical protein